MSKKVKKCSKTKELATKLVNLKYELGTYGLYKSMHSLDETLSVFGWEVAEQLTGSKATEKRKT